MKVMDMRGYERVLKSTKKRDMTRAEKEVVRLYLYEMSREWDYYTFGEIEIPSKSIEDIQESLVVNLSTLKTIDIMGGLYVINSKDAIIKLDRVFCLEEDNYNMYGIARDLDYLYEETGEEYLVCF